MEDKMTAVEWLINELFNESTVVVTKENNPALFEVIEKAKQMEREQKQQAYDDGADDACEMFYQMSKS